MGRKDDLNASHATADLHKLGQPSNDNLTDKQPIHLQILLAIGTLLLVPAW